jgi:hypothetical protein
LVASRPRIDDSSANASFGVQFYADEDPVGATTPEQEKETSRITRTRFGERCVEIESPTDSRWSRPRSGSPETTPRPRSSWTT